MLLEEAIEIHMYTNTAKWQHSNPRSHCHLATLGTKGLDEAYSSLYLKLQYIIYSCLVYKKLG